MPADLTQAIKSFQEPKVNWKNVLVRYLTKEIPIDFSMKPNKRYLAHDLIMPTVVKEGLNMVLAVDTSGSVSDIELQNFVTEVRSMLHQFPAITIVLVDIDTKIQQVRYISQNTTEDMYSSFKGRGGTNFSPLFKSEQGRKLLTDNRPAVVLYYTDGYADDYPQAKDLQFPLIWLVTTKPDTLRESFRVTKGTPMIYVDPEQYRYAKDRKQ